VNSDGFLKHATATVRLHIVPVFNHEMFERHRREGGSIWVPPLRRGRRVQDRSLRPGDGAVQLYRSRRWRDALRRRDSRPRRPALRGDRFRRASKRRRGIRGQAVDPVSFGTKASGRENQRRLRSVCRPGPARTACRCYEARCADSALRRRTRCRPAWRPRRRSRHSKSCAIPSCSIAHPQ
jgi:hypothetical protein